MDVTFYGVRGSTPCAGESTARYGGNTSCVALTAPGHDPILLDLGTGLRYFGKACPPDQPLIAHALVTHLHWDHVQGLPFCPPLLRAGSQLSVYGPAHDGVGFAEAFDQLMRPPFFPVRSHDLPGELRFTTLCPVAPDRDRRRRGDGGPGAPHRHHLRLPHRARRGVGRLRQRPPAARRTRRRSTRPVLELCRDVDLLIHDAQYTEAEFAAKSTWGHCTSQYAVHVATEAGAKRLALFHHDPEHDDDTLDLLSLAAAESGARQGLLEVVAASEGLCISLGASATPVVEVPAAGVPVPAAHA